jgi:hypothetical protein
LEIFCGEGVRVLFGSKLIAHQNHDSAPRPNIAPDAWAKALNKAKQLSLAIMELNDQGMELNEQGIERICGRQGNTLAPETDTGIFVRSRLDKVFSGLLRYFNGAVEEIPVLSDDDAIRAAATYYVSMKNSSEPRSVETFFSTIDVTGTRRWKRRKRIKDNTPNGVDENPEKRLYDLILYNRMLLLEEVRKKVVSHLLF